MTYCERISKLKYARNIFIISLLSLFCMCFTQHTLCGVTVL